MAMVHNNGSWGGAPPTGEECGPQVRPMGLKVHYTFDKDSQDRCLARWPHILHIQTIPMDGQTIGVVDLGLCLQAVSQGSPELVGDDDRDYAIYAFDYSEPDTPLVGQGFLSQGLKQRPDPREPKLITGRVTKNLLAIFGNGIKETLEVKLKLTVISKMPRTDPVSRPHSAVALPQSSAPPSSNYSDNGEWGSFVQSHPGLGQRQTSHHMNLPTLAPAPVRSYSSSFEARNDTPQHYPPLQPAPSSRPGSVDLNSKERNMPSFRQTPPLAPTRQSPAIEEAVLSQVITKPAKSQTQSRPNSRASSRPPTGRPRGRPRKRPLASEGNTSGYEDGTDGDDVPSQNKKRATITKVVRTNTATFGSAPESLRVAASTAGSIRNFRPLAPAGDGSVGAHLRGEGPRAPTPVPGPRFQSHGQPRAIAQSNLGEQPMSFQTVESLPNPPYSDLNSSMSQDGRSPMDSIAPSPFSDEPSPADISSSPPVPRSTMYSIQSSPAPSSPTLPPMRPTAQQPDSGFMSGGIDENRKEENPANKTLALTNTSAPPAVKPKPRRSRAKKQEPKMPKTLHIHNETPGPPELLPQTSIYNPPRPQGSRKKSAASTFTATDTHIATATPVTAPELVATIETGPADEQSIEPTGHIEPTMPTEINVDALQAALNDYPNDQRFFDALDIDAGSFSPADDAATQENDTQNPCILNEGRMEPPAVPTPASEPSVEPELPTVPASDPVLPSLSQTVSMSMGPHPQTDAADGNESRMNKNYVKRQSIKQKLEEAVALGEMPSFCSNCGALQTPTWRKIWKQERRGVPAYHEYSEKPGHVTAIHVLEKDDDGKPTLYEVIKKSLGPTDEKSEWAETILCNPCGIWFSKWKAHRPPEKWEKDEQRLTQTRKKRAAGGGPSRSRKGRAKSDGQMNITSEAYIPTDPAGPSDAPQSPKESGMAVLNVDQAENVSKETYRENNERSAIEPKDQGSTHSRASRGSGTVMSPIDLDEELGATRRLLFPSPRKMGEQRILGEVNVNIVQTGPRVVEIAEAEVILKKNYGPRAQTPEPSNDDFADLFGQTPRPSTPPSKRTVSGSFKTPTQPTPSHRPLTRSVTKSMRSTRLSSPTRGFLERTPTRTPSRTPRKTPRSALLSSGMPRRSPRHLLPPEAMGESGLGTPLTNSISQMLADADHMVMHSPSRGFELDFSSLPHIDNFDQHGELPQFDFATLLGTDSIMPSSPPVLRGGEALSFGNGLEFELDPHHFDFDPTPHREADVGRLDNGDN